MYVYVCVYVSVDLFFVEFNCVDFCFREAIGVDS